MTVDTYIHQPTNLMYWLHGSSRTLRFAASIVLITFNMLIFSPTLHAIQDNPIQLSESTNPEADLSTVFEQIIAQLDALKEARKSDKDTTVILANLKDLSNKVASLDVAVMDNFHKLEADLIAKQLPAVLLQRHTDMVMHYQAQRDAWLERLESETGTGFFVGLLRSTKDWMGITPVTEKVISPLSPKDPRQFKRKQQPFNPNEMSNRSLKPNKDNVPKVNKDEFTQAGLHSTPYTKLAALGDFTFDQLAGASDPVYLAESDEITLSQVIKDKAAELNFDPIKIHHFVRNNIEWVPSWGAIQNADLTLSAQRGNAMDISSLTIALLRASQIPSRYVHGTIDVPRDRFLNWAGGFTDINAAVSYVASAGIPVSTVISGGEISSVRIEHVWVELAIDYFPSRGAKNRSADSWVQFDPSFKQYEFQDGLDNFSITGINSDELVQKFMTSASNNAIEGWVTGFDTSIIIKAQIQAEKTYQDYLNANIPNPVAKDIIGGRKTIIKNYPIVPSSLPYQILVEGARYDKIPIGLQTRIALRIYNSTTDHSFGQSSLSYTLSLSEMGLKRLGITYKPSTETDAIALQEQIDSGANSLSLYLLSVKPTLMLDDKRLALGAGVKMGSDQLLGITLFTPTVEYQVTYNSQAAGDEMVVSIDGGSTSFDLVNQRKDSVASNTSAENLHQIGMNYWAEANYFTQVIASGTNVRALRLPSIGLFSSPLSLTYNFGIPSRGHYIQRTVDIKHNVHAVSSEIKNQNKLFLQQIGTMHSYLEGSILEQAIQNWQGTGLSTVQVLLDANKQSIPIYHVTNDNSETILPRLASIEVDILLDIRAALNAGLEIIIPEREPDKLIGVAGMGYILFDPETGAGSYRISGGLDGGAGEAPCGEPETRPIASAVKDILLTLLLLAALAAIIIASSGTAGPIVAQVLVGAGLTSLTFSLSAGNSCNPIAVPQRGGNKAHNTCADTRIGARYPGFDTCVSFGSETKDFDAFNGSLFEVKTYNFNNSDPTRFLIPEKDQKEWEIESRIARGCGYNFIYTVGDFRHPAALESFQPGFVPTIADELEVDPINCLTPDK